MATLTKTGATGEDSGGKGELVVEELTLDKVIRESPSEEVPFTQRAEW